MARICIVGVGHVSLDHQFSVANPPPPGLKTPASRYRTLVGGMTANAVVAAARLGAAARIVSPVGEDAAPALFRAHFEREGVDARGLVGVAGAHSSASAVIVDAQGERTIVNHRGNALTTAPPLDLALLAGADALLADPRCPRWAEAALRWGRDCRLPTVFDGDTAPREDLQRLVGLAEWAVFSTPGLAATSTLPVAEALGEVLAAGARVAVVTQGEGGLLWRRAGDTVMRHLPARPVVPVLDSTAAGDVFHGALAVALAEGASDEDALAFAATAAALKCARPDGVLGAPTRAEVDGLHALPRMPHALVDAAPLPG